MSLSCLIATHREHHLIDIPKSLQSEDGEKSQKSTMQGLEIDLVGKKMLNLIVSFLKYSGEGKKSPLTHNLRQKDGNKKSQDSNP